ncbi:MAG: arginine deiminase family protein [Collinsella aerofaciens]
MPNLFFTCDPFAVVGEAPTWEPHVLVTRSRETLYGKYVFTTRLQGRLLYFRRDCQFHTEGGDVLNINEKTLAVGISQHPGRRHRRHGPEHLLNPFRRAHPGSTSRSRAFMHLDTVFAQIDNMSRSTPPSWAPCVYELTAGKNLATNIRLIEDTSSTS